MDQTGTTGDGRRAVEGWLFIDPEALPDRWRDRAVTVSLVPLLPGEMSELVDDEGDGFIPQPGDIELIKLVAQGMSAHEMARRLGIATRSVHRRLARLRDRMGVQTTPQLAAEFARRGF